MAAEIVIFYWCQRLSAPLRIKLRNFRQIYVPEVLNVHGNEGKEKSTYVERFFSKQWKINFWERKCDFLSTFLNFNLFYLILVNFSVNFVHANEKWCIKKLNINENIRRITNRYIQFFALKKNLKKKKQPWITTRLTTLHVGH